MSWTAPRTWVVGEIVTAAQMNTHLRDNMNALDRGVYGTRVVGSSGGFGERWHVAGVLTHQGDGFGAGAQSADTLAAVPLISPRGGTLDRIAFNVTTAGGGGSVGRAGIYQATSDTDPYPSARIVDGGEFVTTSTGVKSAAISVVLEPDILYWAVLLFNPNTPIITNLFSSVWAVHALIGMDSAFTTPAAWFRRTQTYGALPSTFPAGPPTSYLNGSMPVIGVRYSA